MLDVHCASGCRCSRRADLRNGLAGPDHPRSVRGQLLLLAPRWGVRVVGSRAPVLDEPRAPGTSTETRPRLCVDASVRSHSGDTPSIRPTQASRLATRGRLLVAQSASELLPVAVPPFHHGPRRRISLRTRGWRDGPSGSPSWGSSTRTSRQCWQRRSPSFERKSLGPETIGAPRDAPMPVRSKIRQYSSSHDAPLHGSPRDPGSDRR